MCYECFKNVLLLFCFIPKAYQRPLEGWKMLFYKKMGSLKVRGFQGVRFFCFVSCVSCFRGLKCAGIGINFQLKI